jgi:hypothetical protein
MPSPTLALRIPPEVLAALDAKCLETGMNKSELALSFILKGLDLPPAPADPLEVRVMELETLTQIQQTQLTQHKEILDGVACELVALYARLDIIDDSANHLEQCFYQEIPDPKPEAIDLKATQDLAAPEQIEDKSSPVSSRDLTSAGTSTPEFDRYAVPILKPYTSGGYYFRFEDIGQPDLKGTIQRQAKQLGFKSDPKQIDGKMLRVWLNREYCLPAV